MRGPEKQPVSSFRDEDGGHGYLVSVSDMMAGLLFLFIITLAVFAVSYQESKEQKEAVTRSLTDSRQARSELLEALKRTMDSHGVRVRIDTERGILLVPEDVLFPSGSAILQPQGETSVRILAGALGDLLPCYSGSREVPRPPGCVEEQWRPGRIEAVLVEGHTDNQPFRGADGNVVTDGNWKLSVNRSITTYRRLMEYREDLERLTNQERQALFSVAGYEATRPVISHQNPTSEPQNRRIELRFMIAAPREPDAETPKIP